MQRGRGRPGVISGCRDTGQRGCALPFPPVSLLLRPACPETPAHPAPGNLRPLPDAVASPSSSNLHSINKYLSATYYVQVPLQVLGSSSDSDAQKSPHIRPLAPTQPRIASCPHSWLLQTLILLYFWGDLGQAGS